MGKESNLWRYIKGGMRKMWHATRHEDGEPGTPDVSYGAEGVNGWIELKVLDSWPKRPDTVVQFKHLTPWQTRWLQTRGDHGGHCFLFVRIESEYLIFKWENVHLLGTLNERELKAFAIRVWTGSVNFGELRDMLTSD